MMKKMHHWHKENPKRTRMTCKKSKTMESVEELAETRKGKDVNTATKKEAVGQRSQRLHFLPFLFIAWSPV